MSYFVDEMPRPVLFIAGERFCDRQLLASEPQRIVAVEQRVSDLLGFWR
jgi:hypothetical protein